MFVLKSNLSIDIFKIRRDMKETFLKMFSVIDKLKIEN